MLFLVFSVSSFCFEQTLVLARWYEDGYGRIFSTSVSEQNQYILWVLFLKREECYAIFIFGVFLFLVFCFEQTLV